MAGELIDGRWPVDGWNRTVQAISETTDEVAVREACVARHAGLGKAETRASAAAEAARKVGWSNDEITDAISEAKTLRAMAQEIIRKHCGRFKADVDLSDVMEAVEGCSPNRRRLMVIERIVASEGDRMCKDVFRQVLEKAPWHGECHPRLLAFDGDLARSVLMAVSAYRVAIHGRRRPKAKVAERMAAELTVLGFPPSSVEF